MYQTRFVVEGRGEFPFDMLRYDACFPASEIETGQMCNSRLREKRQVKLLTYHVTKIANLTEERWASFGWHIIEGYHREGERV